MKNPLIWIVVVIVAVAAAWYFSTRQDMLDMEEARVEPAAESAAQPEPPAIEHPVADIAVNANEETLIEEEPLPELPESDPVVIAELSEWVGNQTVQQHFVTDQLIGRVVATVDGLTRDQVAPLLWPVKPVGGKFRVLEAGERSVISPENADRYQAYVDLALSLETDRMVALYSRYYPLLQQAYEELGYPEGYFNDRVVEVIDDLLAAPEPGPSPEVVKSEAVWVYTDPELERASAGQKLLMRLEPEEAAALKSRLREIRAALVGMEVPEAGEETDAMEDSDSSAASEE